MTWDNLIEVFAPGHRHTREEKERKSVSAQIPGTEGDHPTWVDLDRKIVHITLPPKPAEDEGQ